MKKSRFIGICLSLCAGMTLAAPIQGLFPVYAQPHTHSMIATYVPWGVDEYELIGLTKDEILKKFKELGYDDKESRIYFADYNRPGFGRPGYIVTFANGKVATIKRLFIDGGGCHIIGPVLSSKKEALNFTIEGLLKGNRSAKQEARLKAAQKTLAELDGVKSEK